GERAIEHVIGRFFRNLSSAAETGGLAKPGVERDCRIGRADHADNQGSATGGDKNIAPQRSLIGFARQFGHRARSGGSERPALSPRSWRRTTQPELRVPERWQSNGTVARASVLR